MYLGTSAHPFTSLQAFLAGFDFGSLAHDAQPEQRVDARWDGFREFVAERYGIDHRVSTASWGSWIHAHSRTEEEAFATFFSLFEQYQTLSGLSWPQIEVGRAGDTKA